MVSIKLQMLLYSKFSQSCKKLFEIAETNNFVLENFLQLVCIDNEEFRKKIINNPFKITVVPCILITYDDGTVEKFDGAHAFNFVEEIIRRHSPPKIVKVEEPVRPKVELQAQAQAQTHTQAQAQTQAHTQAQPEQETSHSSHVSQVSDKTKIDVAQLMGSDRNQNQEPVPTIIQNSGNYINPEESKKIYPAQEEQVERKPTESTIKKTVNVMDIMAQLQQERKGIEASVPQKGMIRS